MREDAVNRQQCLTSVSMFTRPSFCTMMPLSMFTDEENRGSTVAVA